METAAVFSYLPLFSLNTAFSHRPRKTYISNKENAKYAIYHAY